MSPPEFTQMHQIFLPNLWPNAPDFFTLKKKASMSAVKLKISAAEFTIQMAPDIYNGKMITTTKLFNN